ncbi:hypothetical protein SAMN05216272_11914 [Pseudomonas panipatensis]|jgi:hypothetical protein|uniref:Uncharacterized protein n=1 Tax=Pseudomonas panipatensis TaxID=428992 RepID=A0A1G8N4F2_9PSED|nr:hypothetical protein SAMN05216272_11914 [Pseudomonas panipatensis]SMP79763.1 hypothetical protein SAMN06295951_12214 [Pseudomonas panipatensis]
MNARHTPIGRLTTQRLAASHAEPANDAQRHSPHVSQEALS